MRLSPCLLRGRGASILRTYIAPAGGELKPAAAAALGVLLFKYLREPDAE
jgi:hypothetical protein